MKKLIMSVVAIATLSTTGFANTFISCNLHPEKFSAEDKNVASFLVHFKKSETEKETLENVNKFNQSYFNELITKCEDEKEAIYNGNMVIETKMIDEDGKTYDLFVIDREACENVKK
ncbi:hypothetical protein [Aliarcobacter cryaerophilus]|uniref:hypothetical protein n=1 Tax=Aliarcobacter cryaerophilus TaxID=28198 RepID=UPI0021B2EA80|nr:hypothetical protein [Aliarcobacter cryaerophilus]MCT7510964.1 hypothetical protein [Aliarcobacter cryaerophilus]